MEIINSFRKETAYEFSESIPIYEDNIHIIFKIDIISINLDPSKSKISKLKGFIVNGKEKAKNSISHLDIEPVAYMLRMDENEFHIEPIDEKYEKIIKDNEKELLNQFLEKK